MKEYHPGELFGELALLYNAPRAATITTLTNSILWSLDRVTFSHIVKDSTMYDFYFYLLVERGKNTRLF